jgi:glyoxylase-like metal-dependent hydrolase (beta-lactamase superfamily II)
VSASWDEVGDGVFRRRYERLDQNVSLIVTTEGLVVVDSRSTHEDAGELRDDLTVISPLEVRYLVNTHFHWDHTFGNAVFRGAEIVGHHRCRDVLLTAGEATKVELSEAGSTSDDERGRFLSVDITPPNLTFSREMTIHLGGRDVRLAHLGRGHTDSDIVVLIDDVVIAGDLVEEGAPPSFGDSYPRDWVETLGALLPSIDGVVIPGHGDVVDRAFVEAQRNEIAAAVASLDSGDGDRPYPPAVMASIAERLAV